MNIKELCYELYKIDWKHSHMITKDVEMDSIKNYYQGLVHEDTEYGYDMYIEDFGYDGELYVCFDEFCGAEYQDKEYICKLLGNEELIAKYYDDIETTANRTSLPFEVVAKTDIITYVDKEKKKLFIKGKKYSAYKSKEIRDCYIVFDEHKTPNTISEYRLNLNFDFK